MTDRRNDAPISERFRIAAYNWVRLDAAARMLEEGKTTFLAQRKNALGEMPDAKAERQVKASDEWADYIKKMVNTRTAALEAKIEVDFLKMQMSEWMSEDANARIERKAA